MSRHIKGLSRSQATLFPEMLDDFVAKENPVRVIDVFVDGLDLQNLGFKGVQSKATGRPGYHPAILLKIYIYGYLNRIQSSRCLERETQRNVELMWLTERLSPDFKTIADFRKDNHHGIKTPVKPSFKCVINSICLVKRLLLLMVVSLRHLTTKIKTTHRVK